MHRFSKKALSLVAVITAMAGWYFINEIGDEFGLGNKNYYPEPVHAKVADGSGTALVIEKWAQELLAKGTDPGSQQPYQVINVKEHGAQGDGNADDSAAIQETVQEAIRLSEKENRVYKVYLPKGVYKVDKNIAVKGKRGDTIALLGEPGTVIDGSKSSSMYLLDIGGEKGSASSLLADITARGGHSLQSNILCKAGDILLISSKEMFNPNRPDYIKGEMVEVEKVEGDTVKLKSPLQDSYSALQTKIYKLNTPKVEVRNIEIQRDSFQAGLKISYSRDVVVANCKIEGARERCFYINYVYGGLVLNNYADSYWSDSDTHNSRYGISIASCQQMLLKGNQAKGGRHGIAHGGWEPCRYIVLAGNTIDSYSQSGQASLDFHENVEKVYVVENNRILNSLNPTCKNIVIENNYIYSDKLPALHYYDLTPDCGYFIVRNNT
ncbi:MAG TPA: glycosyl hydrolase family 28-related protein, partial [Patescibacteria group bacterium]|nr:glycosyl hydrolase family 28-related protein [Patescibacteria group bacterium]